MEAYLTFQQLLVIKSTIPASETIDNSHLQ